MIKPLNKSIAKTVFVIRDQVCHSADSVTSPTAKHIKYEKSPWVISGIKGSTWGLCLPGQRLPSAVTVQMMFSGLSFFSLLYFPCRPNLVLSNALVCVRGDASQPVPSVPWLGRRNVPDMFIPCWWELREWSQCHSWSQSSLSGIAGKSVLLPDRQVGLNDQIQKPELRQISPWAHLGKVWDSFSLGPALPQENATDVCGTLPKPGEFLALEMGFSWKAAISHLLANTGHLIPFQEEKI